MVSEGYQSDTGMLEVFCSVPCYKHLHVMLYISAVVHSNVYSALCVSKLLLPDGEIYHRSICWDVMHHLVHS